MLNSKKSKRLAPRASVERRVLAGSRPAGTQRQEDWSIGGQMWSRIKRLFRSVFGGMIESAEDPELILKQVIRDMNDKVPQMRENVVQVMATEKKLQKEVEILTREITEADYKVKAAIKQGRDDVAKLYITQM